MPTPTQLFHSRLIFNEVQLGRRDLPHRSVFTVKSLKRPQVFGCQNPKSFVDLKKRTEDKRKLRTKIRAIFFYFPFVLTGAGGVHRHFTVAEKPGEPTSLRDYSRWWFSFHRVKPEPSGRHTKVKSKAQTSPFPVSPCVAGRLTTDE